MRLFQLSETTKAVLWLWETDAGNWRVGSHAVVHQPTGIGVWTANKDYGLHLNYEIPDCDRKSAHPCAGRQVDLNKRDRKALYRTIVLGLSAIAHREIQRQISDWGTDHIEHRVGERSKVS